MKDQLRDLVDALGRGQERLLCQVVETRGSTPQKAGALMVVSPDGTQVGTLGGGCVENEIKLKAMRQLGQRGAVAHTVVLDHDYAWADGLICGGRMTFVTESLQGPEDLGHFQADLSLVTAGRGRSEAVVFSNAELTGVPIGARFLFGPDGKLVAARPAIEPPKEALELVAPLEQRPRPAARSGIAWAPSLPRVDLVIVGAGHVGQAVAALAVQCDFDVTIVDDRAEYASPERFPNARAIVVGPIEETLPALDVTPWTYALIVTRGHGHDQEALYHLATTKAGYVGLIGSKRKIRLIFDGLREQGVGEDHLARVTAPVGLDLNSQTVPEIAVSIVAQLVSRRNHGTAR